MAAVSKSSGLANRMSNSPPVDEAPEETAHPSGFPRHWAILGLPIAYAGLGLFYDHSDQTFASLAVGVILSQPILLAFWAAFARQRFYYRLLWSLLFCTYLSFVDELGMAIHGGRGGDSLMLVILAFFVLAFVILLPVRRFSQWQITQPNAKDAPAAYLAHQFGINQFLILTAIVALACGLVRSSFILTRCHFPFPSIAVLVDYFSLLLVVGFPSCVVPWITLAYRRKRYGLMLTTVFVAGALDLVAGYVRLQMYGQAWIVMWKVNLFVTLVVDLYFLMQLGAILSAIVSTLVLRFCGFRMIREPKV